MIQASAFFSFAKIDLIHILGYILALSLCVCAYIPNSRNPSPTPHLQSQPAYPTFLVKDLHVEDRIGFRYRYRFEGDDSRTFFSQSLISLPPNYSLTKERGPTLP